MKPKIADLIKRTQAPECKSKSNGGDIIQHSNWFVSITAFEQKPEWRVKKIRRIEWN